MPRNPSPCPCGSGATLAACCGRYLTGGREHAPTAERLMRSRYTAFTLGDLDHLQASWHRSTRPIALRDDPTTRWTGLDVLARTGGSLFDSEGTVTFRASFRTGTGAGRVDDVLAETVVPERAQVRQFAFDGGAGTYIGTALLGVLVTVVSLGFAFPFALVLRERWRAKHSYIEGRQLVFNGSAWALFGLWWKWLLLIIITIGIYSFWVTPRLFRWKWEHTSWALQAPRQYGSARA